VAQPPVVSTGRVAVVLLVLAGLVFSAALPVRTYLRQRAQISALEQQVSRDQAGVQQLQTSAAQWQDPAYVTAQARVRLGLVSPGETGYIVTDPGGTPAPAETPAVSGAPVRPPGPPAPGPAAVPVGPVPRTGGAVSTVPPRTGADGLARLGAASPWWSPGPSPGPTTAR